jgi:hypothetical protein
LCGTYSFIRRQSTHWYHFLQWVACKFDLTDVLETQLCVEW